MERRSNGTYLPRDIDERFWEKVRLEDEIFPENGCMIWTAGMDADGYGLFWVAPDTLRAGRWIYERLRGPIPAGMQLDHLCRTRACVNPDHLEPVSLQTNISRGLTGQNQNPWNNVKTHCKHGHEFTAENTYHHTRNGRPRRACRTCLRANYRDWWHRKSK